MKKNTGTIILLFVLFVTVVSGVLIVRYYYSKKTKSDYTVLQTESTKEYGVISYQRFYKNGSVTKAFGYYQDGKKKSEYYTMDNSGYAMKYNGYYPDGRVEEYIERWKEGDECHYIQEQFFPDGRLRRREGTKIAKWEYYDDNGELTLIYERNGDRITETLYYPGNMKQEESEYKNGKRDGVWRQWSTIGVLTRNEMYKDGNKL